MTSAVQIAAQTRSFNLETGNASTTLREFARQARVSVVMDRQNVQGVQTNEVSGLLVPIIALERMLDGTPLVFNEDLETGAFAVMRSKVSVADLTTHSSEVQTPDSEQQPIDETEMNNKKKNWLKTLAAVLTLGVTTAIGQTGSSESEAEETVYQLSPFSISEEENIGYMATSTLAGTRLRTALRDVGTAITVVTQEFMEDTNSTDLSDILIYTPNTEVGGVDGNFLGANPNGNLTAEIRNGPQTQTRVRGLGAADLSRGEFFSTAIPMDSYNTDRVDIQRGANAVLFGLGSPAGIINNSLKKAILGKSFGEFSAQYGSHQSYRGSLDYNVNIVDDVFAARIALLHEEQGFEQDFTYTDDQRVYVAFNFSPNSDFYEQSDFFDRTNIRAHVEVGEVQSNRPRSTPPNDGLEPWFNPEKLNQFTLNSTMADRNGLFGTPLGWVAEPGSWWWHNAVIFEDVSSTDIGVTGTPYDMLWAQSGPSGKLRRPNGILNWPAMRGVAQDSIAALDSDTELKFFGKDVDGDGVKDSLKPFWKRQDILDSSVFNYFDTLLEGPNKSLVESFSAYNIALEQTFLKGRLGFQVSIDEQRFKKTYHAFNPRTRGDKITIDINTHLLDGASNPNVGRPFVTLDSALSFSQNWNMRETKRATGFAVLDFEEFMSEGKLSKWLGRHVLTGLLEEHTNESSNRTAEINQVDSKLPTARQAANRGRNFPAWWTTNLSYLGPDLRGKSMQGANIPGIRSDRLNISTGLTSLYLNPDSLEWGALSGIQILDPITRFASQNKIDVDTKALFLNSTILNGWLTGVYGLREDTVKTFSSNAVDLDGDGYDDIEDPNYGITSDTPPNIETGGVETTSWSLVGHLPDSVAKNLPFGLDLDVHYSESENFRIGAERRTFDQRPIPAPSGTTKDYGFTASLFDGKLIARVNRYESSQNNSSSPNSINAWFLYAYDVFIVNAINDSSIVNFSQDDMNTYLTQNGANPGNALPAGWTYGTDIITEDMFRAAMPLGMYDFGRISSAGGNQFQNLGAERLAQTANVESEGTEVELTYNPTANWRILLNVASQEAKATKINSRILPFAEAKANQWLNMPNMNDGETRDRFIRDLYNPYLVSQALNGGPVLELREWRYNLVTNYQFSEGKLKGFGMGGATRWMSESNTGFPVIRDPDTGNLREDVRDPYKGPTEQYYDFWLSYRKPIFDNKVDWVLQLNVKNAFTKDDVVPVQFQPDGSVAAIRILDPRRITLRSTFKF